MTAPYLPLYVGDYMRDTRGLTAEQHGAYLLLLMCMWSSGGSLPADDKKLARFASCTPSRWSKIKADILAYFEVGEETITHRRLTAELEKAQEKSIKRSVSGTKGGHAKALKDKAASLANDTYLPCHSSEPEPDQNKTRSNDRETRASALVQSFDPNEVEILPPEPAASRQADQSRRPVQGEFDRVFWPAYPHKVGKHAAASAWAKVCRRDDVWLDAITRALRRYVEAKPPDRPWCNPATWLNQGRWTDEPSDDPEPSRQDRAYSAGGSNGSGAHDRMRAGLAKAFGLGGERGPQGPDDTFGNGAYYGAAFRN